MDWQALALSLKLGGATLLILLPLGILVSRALAWKSFRGKAITEALLALPLVLPPTVLGFYLLLAFGGNSTAGHFYQWLTGRTLTFTFDGLLLASVIFNLPFAIQPMQRAFEAIPSDVRDAAACSGLTGWQTFLRIELPLAWPGIITALVMTFAHTLGEFGVVLMMGGSIPGETRTIAISIYDRVQAFDDAGAAMMSATLLLVSLAAMAVVHATSRRTRHGRR